MTNEAAEANAALAAIRKAPHNGVMFQADDVDYLNALAVTAGNGLGAINPNWFRDQAKLVAGTLAEVERLRVMNDRHAVASECLRQLWQMFDAGGISMGRSQQAKWLETAMDLIAYDHRYSSMADNDPHTFDQIRADARHEAQRESMAVHDAEMGYEPRARLTLTQEPSK